MYAFYPTLLDAFSWYKRSESETALQEFLDKVNRVKTPATDPMLRGIAFNDKVDHAIRGGQFFGVNDDGEINVHDTPVSLDIINEFRDLFHGSALQVFLDTRLNVGHHQVKIYGYADALKGATIGEFKTTAKYEFPKYLHNWQHPCYLQCLKENGIKRFTYLITDFKEVYREDYHWTREGEIRLIGICNELIEFLEAKRDLITDTKVFGG